eukprot:7170329-Prymnesium_polylepis.1
MHRSPHCCAPSPQIRARVRRGVCPVGKIEYTRPGLGIECMCSKSHSAYNAFQLARNRVCPSFARLVVCPPRMLLDGVSVP